MIFHRVLVTRKNIGKMYGFISEDGKYIPCSCLNINGGYIIQCWYGKVKMLVDKVDLVLRVVEGIDYIDRFLFEKESNLQLFELDEISKRKIFGYNDEFVNYKSFCEVIFDEVNRFKFIFEIMNKIVIGISNFYLGMGIIIYRIIVSIESIILKYREIRKEMKGFNHKVFVKKNNEIFEEMRYREVLPGMICQLCPKDVVFCDFIIIKGGCVVDESNLSGESDGIVKKIGDRVYSGSVIIEEFHCEFMVNQIGMNTRKEICKMGIVGKNKRIRGMEREFMIIFAMMIIFGCVIVGMMYYYLQKKYRGCEIIWSLCELFFLIVPSNIMEIVEISDRQMSFIVGFLKGKCNDICKFKEIGYCKEIIFDKTGTLTQKKFQCEGIERIFTNLDIAIMVECVSNRITLIEEKGCIEYIGDEIEISIQKYHRFRIKKDSKGKRIFEIGKKKYDEIVTFEFDPFRCIQSTVVKDRESNKYYICGKGKCESEIFVKNEMDNIICRKIEEGYRKGFKLLKFGYREISQNDIDKERYVLEKKFQCSSIGFFSNKIQKDGFELMKKAHKKYRLIMCTGDCFENAVWTYQKLGMKNAGNIIAMSGKEVEDGIKSGNINIDNIDIVYRANPEQKSMFVSKKEEKRGIIYVGDGINDVGALKMASCGIFITNKDSMVGNFQFSKLRNVYEFLEMSELCGYKTMWRYVNCFRISVIFGIIKVIAMMHNDISNSIFYYIVSILFIYSFFILTMWRLGLRKTREFNYEKVIILPLCIESLVAGLIMFFEIFFINKLMFNGFPWGRCGGKESQEIKTNWISMVLFGYESIWMNYIYEQEFLNELGSNIVFVGWNIFVIVSIGIMMLFPKGLIQISYETEYFKICTIIILVQSTYVLIYYFRLEKIFKIFKRISQGMFNHSKIYF